MLENLSAEEGGQRNAPSGPLLLQGKEGWGVSWGGVSLNQASKSAFNKLALATLWRTPTCHYSTAP